MERRVFIKSASVAVTALGCFPADLSGIFREVRPDTIEKRSLGKTGVKLSILGFGGVVVMNATSSEASSRVSEAIDFGINYFDVAPNLW